MNEYNLRVKYKKSRPDEVWGPYPTREAAVDVMQRAESYPSVVDVILERDNG